MKANYHTHTTWCDGRNTTREMAEAALAKGFDALGFSSHAMLPQDDVDWVLTPEKAPRYAAEVRALADEYRSRLRILCGVEADYVPGGAEPSRAAYASVSPDYMIGSVHFVRAADGALVPVDLIAGAAAVLCFPAQARAERGTGRAIALWMLGLSALLTLLAIAVTGSFGHELTAELSRPFFVLVRTLRLFNTLERMEALVVMLWIFPDFLAASLFHFGTLTVPQVKEYLASKGVPVRPTEKK